MILYIHICTQVYVWIKDLILATIANLYSCIFFIYCFLKEKAEVHLESDLKVREAWESNKSRYLKSNSLFH